LSYCELIFIYAVASEKSGIYPYHTGVDPRKSVFFPSEGTG
jgi:hypothetical protein